MLSIVMLVRDYFEEIKMASGYNCTLCKECDNLTSLQKTNLLEVTLVKICELLLISSVVIVLHLVDIVISSECKFKKMKLSEIKIKSKRFFHIILLSLLILILPFITILITGALMYKVLCSVAIKRKDKRFVQFLDSFDVFYCLEDKKTTDIQGTIQSETIELAMDNIKEKLSKVFTNYSGDQIFYRRNEEYGFYYWRRYSNIDLAQYVQIEEVSEATNKEELRNTRKLDTELQNADRIFRNDEVLFKVVISKNFRDEAKDEYKITLKFHQSVKYTALIEFVTRLMETTNDFHVPLNFFPELKDYDSPDALINMIIKLYDILVHSLDDNNLNEFKLNKTAHCLKLLEWSKSDENLLCKVNNVCESNLHGLMRNTIAIVINKLKR